MWTMHAKEEEADGQFITVLEIYGNVFYGGKARDSTAEILGSCYDEMICIEMEICTIWK